MGTKAHKTAEVSKNTKIGKNVYIWHHAQIRENAKIGNNCIIGKNVYIDHDVIIGNNVKIQNNSSIYFGSKIEDGVFIGPHVCLTNDKSPRAITKEGKLDSGGLADVAPTILSILGIKKPREMKGNSLLK